MVIHHLPHVNPLSPHYIEATPERLDALRKFGRTFGKTIGDVKAGEESVAGNA